MRKLSLVTLIAAASFASLAHAAPAPAPNTQIDPASVSISAPRGATYAIPEYEHEQYNRQFALANGQRLTVTASNSRFYAQIDKKAPFEIVPTGRNTFAGKHKAFEVRLDDYLGDRVHDVVLGVPAN